MGRDYGTEVEVVSGLTPDATLITNPGDGLLEGKPVKIAVPKSKSQEK